jgi:hypothetical protein
VPPLQMNAPMYSDAHCASAVHALHERVVVLQIKLPAAQSPAARQLPSTHDPLLQRWFGPWPVVVETHSPSDAQVAQLLLLQTWVPLQSAPVRQVPGVQLPFGKQTWPEPHWVLLVHGVQLWLMQTWPLLQFAFVRQVPAMQAPPSQIRPVPQLLSVVQAPQVWLAVQTWPFEHSALLWHVPMTQPPETQMYPAP